MPQESPWEWIPGRAEPVVTVEGWERWFRTHPRLKAAMGKRPGEPRERESE